MKKIDMVRELSVICDMPQKEVNLILENFFNKVMKRVSKGEKVSIRHFGTFQTKKRNPRIARNVVEGTRVFIPERNLPVFEPSKEFKYRVESSGTE